MQKLREPKELSTFLPFIEWDVGFSADYYLDELSGFQRL